MNWPHLKEITLEPGPCRCFLLSLNTRKPKWRFWHSKKMPIWPFWFPFLFDFAPFLRESSFQSHCPHLTPIERPLSEIYFPPILMKARMISESLWKFSSRKRTALVLSIFRTGSSSGPTNALSFFAVKGGDQGCSDPRVLDDVETTFQGKQRAFCVFLPFGTTKKHFD